LAHRALYQAEAQGRRDDQFGITDSEDAQARCATQHRFPPDVSIARWPNSSGSCN
jgi:hypothetical protein